METETELCANCCRALERCHCRLVSVPVSIKAVWGSDDDE